MLVHYEISFNPKMQNQTFITTVVISFIDTIWCMARVFCHCFLIEPMINCFGVTVGLCAICSANIYVFIFIESHLLIYAFIMYRLIS